PLRAARAQPAAVRRAEPGAGQGRARAARALHRRRAAAARAGDPGAGRTAARRDAGARHALTVGGAPVDDGGPGRQATSMTRVCVLGPSGKMGRALLEAARGRDDVRVTAAVDRPDAGGLGVVVADGVVASADLEAGLAACDVYLDFTSPVATRKVAEVA